MWPGGNRPGNFCEPTHVTAVPLLATVISRRRPRARRGAGRVAVVDHAAQPDADLVGLVATGDDLALAELHRRHGGLATAVARRLVADAGSVQEVVQDAFVDLWRTAPTFDGDRAEVTSWLVRLVRLRAIDRLRRDGAARRGSGEVAAELGATATEPAAPDDVHAAVEAEERVVRVRDALDALPPDQRRVIELAFLEGLTHTELAERLELPVGTVKTRCFRGLRRLAELLADEREGAMR